MLPEPSVNPPPLYVVHDEEADQNQAPITLHPSPTFPVWAPIALLVMTVASWSGRAMLPLFDRLPLLVIGLAPEPLLISMAANKLPYWPLLLVTSIRLLLADPIWYYLGRYCTEWVLSSRGKKKRKRLKKARKILEALVEHKENKHLKSRAQRWLIQGTVLVLVFVYPTGFVLCAAGILELRRRAVAALAITGTVLQVHVLMTIGSSFF